MTDTDSLFYFRFRSYSRPGAAGRLPVKKDPNRDNHRSKRRKPHKFNFKGCDLGAPSLAAELAVLPTGSHTWNVAPLRSFCVAHKRPL